MGKVTVFFCGNSSLGRILKLKCDEFGFTFKKEVFQSCSEVNIWFEIQIKFKLNTSVDQIFFSHVGNSLVYIFVNILMRRTWRESIRMNEDPNI